jgi:hypothetical protein
LFGVIANTPLVNEVPEYNRKLDSIHRSISLSDDSFKAITRQLMAHGLIEPQLVLRHSGDTKGTYTSSDRCWVLTAAGKKKFLSKAAFRASVGQQAASAPHSR